MNNRIIWDKNSHNEMRDAVAEITELRELRRCRDDDMELAARGLTLTDDGYLVQAQLKLSTIDN